jgi:hypothetical protein
MQQVVWAAVPSAVGAGVSEEEGADMMIVMYDQGGALS